MVTILQVVVVDHLTQAGHTLEILVLLVVQVVVDVGADHHQLTLVERAYLLSRTPVPVVVQAGVGHHLKEEVAMVVLVLSLLPIQPDK